MSLSIEKYLVEEVVDDIQEVAVNLLSTLTVKTPVDTGQARYNWRTSIINYIDGTLNYDGDGNAAGAKALKRGSVSIKAFDLSKHKAVYITNNLPYIERLNNGWSEQAPINFVEQAMEVAVRGN